MKKVMTKFVVLCFISVLLTFFFSYAFFHVQTSKEENLSIISSNIECLDISFSESNNINLDYQYPISDDFAIKNITPLTVTITNNCKNNTDDINYTLALTTLSNNYGFISDNAMKIYITKDSNNEGHKIFRYVNYLSSLFTINEGDVYNHLNYHMKNSELTNVYDNKTHYNIDSSSINNNEIISYNIYLWIDYWEGDITKSGLKDNTTEGLNFKSLITLVTNSNDPVSSNPDSIYINDIKMNENDAVGVINNFYNTFFDITTILNNENSLITYDITLYNNTLITQQFKSIEIVENDNDDIVFEIIGIDETTEIGSKQSYNFSLIVKYKDNVPVDNKVLNSKFNILFDNTSLKLNELIRLNEKEPINNEDGLYIFNETKYYFSGQNVNNYLWFNCKDNYNSGESYCEKWRIISINSDGSIKIIKDSVVSQEFIEDVEINKNTLFWKEQINDDYKTNQMISAGKIKFDSKGRRPSINLNSDESYCILNSNGCNAYAKNNSDYKGLVVDLDSSIKIYLDTIYYEYGLTNNAKKILQKYNYNSGLVSSNKKINDLITSEESVKVESFIALPNISDYVLATQNTNCRNSNYEHEGCAENNWLKLDNVQYVLLNGKNNSSNAQIWTINSIGKVYSQDAAFDMYLRPVVVLNSNVLASGLGTVENPYSFRNSRKSIFINNTINKNICLKSIYFCLS